MGSSQTKESDEVELRVMEDEEEDERAGDGRFEEECCMIKTKTNGGKCFLVHAEDA